MTKFRRFTPTTVLAFALVLMLVLLLSTTIPRADNFQLAEHSLTLHTVTELPLANYASLTFLEGGGLCRLYDQQHLHLLENGTVYDLVLGLPPADRSPRGHIRTANYAVILSMTARDGTVITTQETYEALQPAPGRKALALAALVLIMLLLTKPLWRRFSRRFSSLHKS